MNTPEHIQTVYKNATCLYTKVEVEAALDKMAVEIHEELHDKNPLIIGVMIGGVVPLGHLLTRLDFPLEVDYVHATRYRGEVTGGELHWKAKPQRSLEGRTLLIVDDILDGGITLGKIIEEFQKEGAGKIYTAVLVDKHTSRLPGGVETVDFVGLEVENQYVFGYGLDYHEYLRNAPGIYKVAPEHAV